MLQRSPSIFAVLTLVATMSLAAPPPASPDPAARARQFVELFLAGDDTAAGELLDAKMSTVMKAEQSAQIRAGLEAQYGGVEKIGEAWLEASEHAGFQRFRVPVDFAGVKMDIRVTLDVDGRVAGFFLEPRAPSPSEAPKPPAGVREVEISIGVGKKALPGTLSLPAGKGPFPAVVLVHGSGPSDRDGTVFAARPLRDLAWGLASRGVAALRYEKRSRAHPEQLAALGDALTVEEEVLADARAAVELLTKGRPEIDRERIYVLGHSLGGTLAPRIARRDGLGVAGIVVLAGMTLTLPEKILDQGRYLAAADGAVDEREKEQLAELETALKALRAALDGTAEPPEDPFFGVPFGYYRDLEAHDPASTAAGLDMPILVLQGERDYQVTMEDFARWKKALAEKPEACLLSYPELDHLFRAGEGPSSPADYRQPGEVDARVIDDVAGWILERKCGGEPELPSR